MRDYKINNAKRILKTKKFSNMYEIIKDLDNNNNLNYNVFENLEDSMSQMFIFWNSLKLSDIIDLKRQRANKHYKYRKIKNNNSYFVYYDEEIEAICDYDDELLFNFLNDLEWLSLSIIVGFLDFEDIIK